jgi:hypothetical protein
MIRAVLAALLVFGPLAPASAFRVLEALENGVELSLAALQLPAGDGGSVSFRTCAECPTRTHRVNGETQYYVNRAPVALADFVLAADEVRAERGRAESTLVTVYYDVKTETVTRVVMTAR